MRHLSKPISCALLLAALALAGCGGDAPATAVAPIVLNSPAFSTGALPARYTCDGSDVSPPISWGAVPPHTSQLALFLIAFTPQQRKGYYRVSVEWAVAGLNPALHGLSAGQLPPGAYLGVASDKKRQGYRICPRKGARVQYQFEVYAVPPSERISPDFASVPVIDALTGRTSPLRAKGHGAFVTSYVRR
jgi:phosphatidylethanolamine-binding protein (PEBP) family uncharacterized protein